MVRPLRVVGGQVKCPSAKLQPPMRGMFGEVKNIPAIIGDETRAPISPSIPAITSTSSVVASALMVATSAVIKASAAGVEVVALLLQAAANSTRPAVKTRECR